MSNTYQKTNINYGSLPSQDTLGTNTSATSPPLSKASQRKSILVKGAALVATLVIGILVGSAVTRQSDLWVEEQDKPTSTSPISHANDAVECPDSKSTDEADAWAKIKEESLGTYALRWLQPLRTAYPKCLGS
jgi:hypothetical protein